LSIIDKRKAITRTLGIGFIALALVLSVGIALAVGLSDDETTPRYDDGGDLLLPDGFESWVFVGSSLGLTYGPEPPSHDMFHNVYIEPSAYQHYVETGAFPDQTMLAMTLYGAREKTHFGSGLFSGDFHGLEIAVKDVGRFDEEWSYYAFSGSSGRADRASRFERASCHDCHVEHAKDDNVFVQYYPVIRRVKTP